MEAPAPAIPDANVSFTGPLPPLPASEVQSRVEAAGKPVPVQLQTVAGHMTDGMLPLPARTTPAETFLATVCTVKFEASRVPSGPNWDQAIVSLAACAAWLVTNVRLSA